MISLTEMFTTTEKAAALYPKLKFLTSSNSNRHHHLFVVQIRKPKNQELFQFFKTRIIIFLKKMWAQLYQEETIIPTSVEAHPKFDFFSYIAAGFFVIANISVKNIMISCILLDSNRLDLII